MGVDVCKKAMEFAVSAFDGQVRKAEPEKDSVLHSIDVANKLRKYGFDNNVIAAGYLHDVVEDTNYTLDDINNLFGDDIASLVKGATEEDRSLSWEERKQGTIYRIRNLDLRHKAVIACDKISNSEDLLYLFGREGKEDYSAFSRGRDKKIWYWEEVYKSLVYNQNEDMPMFKELRRNIDYIFYNNYISNDFENLIKFRELELYKLFNIVKDFKSYNIELFGNCYDDVNIIKEFLRKEINFIYFVFNDRVNILEELIRINKDYLNGKLSSDLYIELLDKSVWYIRDNIDKIIFINSCSSDKGVYNEAVGRVINLFDNNKIDYDVVNLNKDDINITAMEMCINLLVDIRKKRLVDIKRLIRKK